MKQKKYYPEVNRLRGIAILMVILYHSIIVYPINLNEVVFWGRLHSFLWTVEMPLFFLISGFCFSYEEDYKSYICKKSSKLLIPHFVFGILDLLPRMFSNPLVNETYSIKQAWIELLLYSSNEWFLWTLFLMFLLAPLLQKGLKRGKISTIFITIIISIAYLVQNIVTPLLSLKNVAGFFIYFWIGMLLRKHEKKSNCINSRSMHLNNNSKKVLVICAKVLLVPVGILMFWGLSWQGWHGHAYAWVELFGEKISPIRDLMVITILPGLTGVKMLWLIVTLITTLIWCVLFYWIALKMKSGWVSIFLEYCGKYSLPMYLLDGYALVASRTLLVTILGIEQAWLIVSGNFVIDTGLVMCIICVFRQFKITRYISGIDKN